MAELINDKKVFSLLEVTQSIQKAIADRYKNAYWIKAEMNKLNFYSHSGHCYPELVEKQEGKIIAQLKATLWRDDYERINNAFLEILKEPLKDGIKILFQAKISFDPNYGLSLRIMDIDASYSLGDLEKERQDTIRQLSTEGIYSTNKSLRFPLLPQRIALISVETSKGYADFLKVLNTNHWNYHFFHLLFPSLLQGDKAVASIIHQLRQIRKIIHHFDVVAIIRGGGGDIGLSCYNNYELAKEIALFPIPVLTGIGHATNETVVEMIAFSNAITPTKLAEYLIQHFHNFSVPVQKAEEKIADKSRRLISDERARFVTEVKLFRAVTESILQDNRNLVKEQASSLVQHAGFRFKNEKSILDNNRVSIRKEVSMQLLQAHTFLGKHTQQALKGATIFLNEQRRSVLLANDKLGFLLPRYLKSRYTELEFSEKHVENMNPLNVLKRGYSITLHNGKAITGVGQVKAGDELQILLADGSIDSKVKTVHPAKE